MVSDDLDEDLERGFADASRAYFRGDYVAALELLDDLRTVGADHVRRSTDILLARSETLIVMGRESEGRTVLEHVLSSPRFIGQLPLRCWLYAACLGMGDQRAAEDEIGWLESEEHATTRIGASMILTLAWFMAFLGDLERCERHLTRWVSLLDGIESGSDEHLEGFVKTAIFLAEEGRASERAADWSRDLCLRVSAGARQTREERS